MTSRARIANQLLESACAGRVHLLAKIQWYELDGGRVRFSMCRQHLKDRADRFPIALACSGNRFADLYLAAHRVVELIRHVAVGQQIERRAIRRGYLFDEDTVFLPQACRMPSSSKTFAL